MKQIYITSTNYRISLLFLIMVISVVLLGGCNQSNPPAQNASNSSLSDKDLSPLQAQLSINGTPSLDQPVGLTLTFFSETDAPNTVAQILLPGEFELVSGDLIWKGHVIKDNNYTLSAIVKAIKKGDTTIRGQAISGDKSYIFGDIDNIYVSVFTNNATVTHNRPIPPQTEETTIPLTK